MRKVLNLSLLILFLAAAVATIYGYGANILTLFDTSLTPLTGAAVLRIIGIFIPPLGVVMGYI